MDAPRLPLTWKAGLLATSVAAAATFASAEPSKTDKDAFPSFENQLTVGGQASWAKGDKSAFQADQATAKNGFGGIESFQYSRSLKNDFALTSDGHALLNNNDYLAHLNVSKSEFGSVDVGYKRFRTYYDNAGGFFLPTSNAWAGLMPFPEELYIDRSKFWAEANLTLPDKPSITIRYTNELRNGRKDSTIWGASDYTGLNSQSNSANVASRYIAPGFLEVGERHEKLEALAKHTVGDTSVELALTGDRTDNTDTRYFDRYPGQIKSPAIASTPVTVVTPANVRRMNNEIYGFDRLSNKANTFAAALKAETKLGASTRLHGSVSYSLLHSDIKQYRPLFTITPYPTTAPVGYVNAYSANALDLIGGAKIKTLSGNIGADFVVAKDFTIETAIKAEDYYRLASDSYKTIGAPTVSNTGVVTAAAPANLAAGSRTKEKSLTPEISARYTGIRNITLYGTAEYKNLWGKERVTPQYNVITATPSPSNDDVSENHGRYAVGANWAPRDAINLRAETFYKDHHNSFEAVPGATASFFVLGYKMKGAKFTAVLRPDPTVTFTTRYILQTGTMETSTETLAEYRSMESKSHTIGETIDWNPVKQFYLQANLNVVYDTTSTSYPRAGRSAASSGNDAIHNADNNYWNGSVLAGFVVDKVTNAELQYSHYKANNYEAAFISSGLPYGTSQREYSVTLGLRRKLTDKLIAEAKVGYLNGSNDTTGGNTNYSARIAYLSLQQAF